jgi:phage head maturation protease
MRVAKTPMGDETLELVREGALPHLSIGFRERQDGNLRMAGGIVARTKADMFEIASTLEGAYGDLASAVGVRSSEGYRGAGSLLEADEAELRAATEDVLLHGLPPLPDLDDRIRALRLGLI